MADQVLQELSKHTINISKFEETTLTWHESVLTLLTEKGVHFFEFSHNLHCMEKKIDCIQSFIGHPKYSPASVLFTDSVLNQNLNNFDLTEMIVDHALWPHNSQLLQEMSTIIDFKWSPNGIANNHDSAIAILTNVGVVEIYKQDILKWKCAVGLSTLLTKERMMHSELPRTVEVLKETVYTLATTAMCWCPVLNQDRSCYFITAQKNGDLILWLIECEVGNSLPKPVTSLQSGTCEIVSMVWIPLYESKFLLICSNILGQIIVIECVIENTLQLIQSHTIWSHKDRMISKYLNYVEITDKIVLVCNKNRHLLGLMIDHECNVIGQYINNINDYRITSVAKSGNEIYVTTINCKIFRVNLNISESLLEINTSPIECQGFTSTQELYSIHFSQNKMLCALSLVDRKVNCRKDPTKIELLFMSTKEKLDSLLDTLLDNPTKRLTNYWDVIEVLRYKTMKSKQAPAVDYDQLYEMACSDIYLLKVYMIICTLCSMLKKLFKLGYDFPIPEDSVDVVKEEILVAHADQLIHKYHKRFVQQGKLDHLELEYMIGARNFLEYFFKKNKRNLNDVIDSRIMGIMQSKGVFTCQCCDEDVRGFECKNNHKNMFCALTLTPICSDSYLICKWCNLTARTELLSESPTCLFCDTGLQLLSDED